MAVDQIAMRFWFLKYGFVKLDGLGSNSWQFSCHRCLTPWAKQPQSSLHFCELRAWHTLGKHTATQRCPSFSITQLGVRSEGKWSHRLTCLNTQSLVDGTAWEGLKGGVSLRLGFDMPKDWRHSQCVLCLLILDQDMSSQLFLPPWTLTL